MNFFERVYSLVREIPKGKVATYGQIAKMLSKPNMSRFVGYALHSNPNPKMIPCHRVVNRFGKVSASFAFGGAGEQQKRLESEGVVFDEHGKIDLERFQWKTFEN